MKPKYKFGQLIESESIHGVVESIVLNRDEPPLYVLKDGSKVRENEVTAVFVPRKPREPKPRTAKPRSTKNEKKAA